MSMRLSIRFSVSPIRLLLFVRPANPLFHPFLDLFTTLALRRVSTLKCLNWEIEKCIYSELSAARKDMLKYTSGVGRNVNPWVSGLCILCKLRDSCSYYIWKKKTARINFHITFFLRSAWTIHNITILYFLNQTYIRVRWTARGVKYVNINPSYDHWQIRNTLCSSAEGFFFVTGRK